MRIELPDGIHIVGADDKQFILYRRNPLAELKTGEEDLAPVSYWPSMRWLLRGLAERKLRLSGAVTLADLAAEMRDLYDYIDLATGYVPPPAPADKRKRGAATSATSKKEDTADGPAEETALMSIM